MSLAKVVQSTAWEHTAPADAGTGRPACPAKAVLPSPTTEHHAKYSATQGTASEYSNVCFHHGNAVLNGTRDIVGRGDEKRDSN